MKLIKFPPLDANGAEIRPGDIVKVIGMPDFHGQGAIEFRTVFSFLIGKYKRVSGFDEYGALEIYFHVRKARKYLTKGRHFVSLEPWFTKVRLSKRRTHNKDRAADRANKKA